MFYNLLYPLADQIALFNLFKYLTVRAGGAFGTAFVLSLILGPWLIRSFRHWQNGGQTVKDILPHAAKIGTPTMGGALLMGTFFVGALLWSDLSNPYVWSLLTVAMGFTAIGATDDLLALASLWKKGMPGRVRLLFQFIISAAVVYLLVHANGSVDATTLYFPFFKTWEVDLGVWGFTMFGAFVIVGAANAVNLTDGLDGLVSIPAVIVAFALAMLAYIIGRADYTSYLNIAYIPGAGEVAVICAALAGSVLGFLWFNAPPARIFMGDTGSLPVGALLGTVAVIIKQEFVLAIIGGLFVLETVSVIVQVASFKLTGKRVFKMAPLHHHFEQLGWPESTIVVRFWIIALVLAMVGLATLKLR